MVQLSRIGLRPGIGGGGQDGGAILPPTTSYTGGTQTRLGQGVGYYNLDKPYGLAFRALLRSHAAFTALCIGDSTTAGVDTQAGVPVRANSWPTRLAANLDAAGWPTSLDSYMGDANTGSGANFQTFIPQMITIGSGWAFGSVETMGGKNWQNSTTTTGDLSFQRVEASNCVDVLTIGTGHTLKVRYGNIDQANITPASAPLLTRVTWANAGTVMAMRRVSGTVTFSGAIMRDTTSPRIDLVNAGRSGSGTAYWSDSASPNRALNCLPILAAEVVLIDLLIADWGDSSGVSTATTTTNLTTIIDKIIAYGGIPVFVVPHPTPTSIASAQRQADWTDVKYNLSDLYGIPLFDLHAHFGNDYTTGIVNAGFATVPDSSHINAAGYADCGDFIGAGLSLLAA